MSVPALLLINQIQRGDPFDFGFRGGAPRPPRRECRRINWYGIMVWSAIVALLGGFVWFVVKETREENRLNAIQPIVYTIPMGYVKRIGECNSGKHYYNCWVYPSNAKPFNTDVTDWPPGILDPSTELHWEIWTQDTRQRQFICNPKQCVERNRFYKDDEGYSEEFAKGN